MKVSVIGGASVATVQLANALASWTDAKGTRGALELSLYGRDEEKLARVADAARLVLEGRVALDATTDVVASLRDAEIVVVQVRIGGLGARRFDETFARAQGLPGEETMGPGGFANALRTVPALTPLFDTMAKVAPNALVVLLSNPAGIVRQVASRRGLRAVSVCEAPHVLLAQVAEVLRRPIDELMERYVGMNHVGFYVAHDDEELRSLHALSPVAPRDIDHLGALPLAYVRYYSDPRGCLNSQVQQAPRSEQLMDLERDARRRLASGELPDAQQRPSPWYSLALVPVIDALVRGVNETILFGAANAHRVATLSDAATLEGPGSMNALDWTLHQAVELPAGALALLERHSRYEDLAVEASLDPTPEKLGAALSLNPMVDESVAIDRLVEAILSSPFGPHYALEGQGDVAN